MKPAAPVTSVHGATEELVRCGKGISGRGFQFIRLVGSMRLADSLAAETALESAAEAATVEAAEAGASELRLEAARKAAVAAAETAAERQLQAAELRDLPAIDVDLLLEAVPGHG